MRTVLSQTTDFSRFFRSWLADPRRVASVAPSSDTLARLITRGISPSDGAVLELGVGTGVFTRALLDLGIPEDALTLVECDDDFAATLRERFPRARVVQANATLLARREPFAADSFGAVVSGLPLLTMPPRRVMEILSGAFDRLRPAGSFYQFTYFPRCPVPRALLERLGLKAVCVGGTLWNLPPARVYRISRRQPLAVTRRDSRVGTGRVRLHGFEAIG
ncbi:methyltransferase domain-containing protein [Variovorax sp. ZS18.2.2]|uniref:class I SAM-dependent methyltransferase n=1 Tax=Variovorax sp. ZS18.2.2 TaxID=2971255 RepID=UPI002150A12C|nr:methyltransferase domain-containing protein [Variovorax sp. ZS18.2.2]MCR6478188.1 methyltransferase domain-containing protein [Variovorax sp. ZS18.2.2]